MTPWARVLLRDTDIGETAPSPRQAEVDRPALAPTPSRAARAVEWLHQNYAKGASVEDAAKALRMSRSGLFRIVRDHTGQNPKAYLDHLRIEHAKHLLRRGGYMAKEIAGRCGFANARHFTRAFVRKTGQAPTAWAASADAASMD